MVFEILNSSTSYTAGEYIYMVALLVAAAFAAIYFHALGHRIMQNICMGRHYDKRLKESANPLRVFTLSNLLSVAVFCFFSFAWLKPSKTTDTRGKNMLISLSGSVFNLFMAFVSILGNDAFYIASAYTDLPSLAIIAMSFLTALASANIAFALFNLLPIPSLDGAVFVAQLLPEKVGEKYLSFKRYSLFLITVAIVLLSRSGAADAMIGAVSETFDGFIIGIASQYFTIA